MLERVEDGVTPSFRSANTTLTAASGRCARPHLHQDRTEIVEHLHNQKHKRAPQHWTKTVPALTRTAVRNKQRLVPPCVGPGCVLVVRCKFHRQPLVLTSHRTFASKRVEYAAARKISRPVNVFFSFKVPPGIHDIHRELILPSAKRSIGSRPLQLLGCHGCAHK